MNRNWGRAGLLLALLLVSTSGFGADTRIRATELALEVRLDAIRWPERQDGALLVTPCRGCAVRSLSLDARTQLFWNDASIPWTTLRQRARAGKPAAVTLIYERASGRLSRILGHG